MRKGFLLVTFLLCSSLWYSCSFTSSVVLQPNVTYEKIKPNDVVLYLSAEDLPKNYEKVGLIDISIPVSLDRKIEESREAAAKMGANGIYWRNFYRTNQGSYNITGDTIVVGQQGQNPNFLIAIRTK